MSMPAGRDVVATRTLELPVLEAGEGEGPLRLAAVPVNPLRTARRSLLSVSARRLARCFVRVNAMTLFMSPRPEQLQEQVGLQVLRNGIESLRDAGRPEPLSAPC